MRPAAPGVIVALRNRALLLYLLAPGDVEATSSAAVNEMRAKSAGLLSDAQSTKSDTGSGGLGETYPRLYAIYSLTTGSWTLLLHAFRQRATRS